MRHFDYHNSLPQQSSFMQEDCSRHPRKMYVQILKNDRCFTNQQLGLRCERRLQVKSDIFAVIVCTAGHHIGLHFQSKSLQYLAKLPSCRDFKRISDNVCNKVISENLRHCLKFRKFRSISDTQISRMYLERLQIPRSNPSVHQCGTGSRVKIPDEHVDDLTYTLADRRLPGQNPATSHHDALGSQ